MSMQSTWKACLHFGNSLSISSSSNSLKQTEQSVPSMIPSPFLNPTTAMESIAERWRPAVATRQTGWYLERFSSFSSSSLRLVLTTGDTAAAEGELRGDLVM